MQALDAVGFVWEAQRGIHRKKKSPETVALLGGEESGLTREHLARNGAAGQSFGTLSRSSQQNAGGFPFLNLRQEIPPALLSHVVSLLGANQQSIGPQTSQMGERHVAEQPQLE